MSEYNFKVDNYFPTQFRVFGVGLIGVGVLAMLASITSGNFASIALELSAVVAGYAMFTTRYMVTINTEARTIHDFVWVLGMKKGEKIKYDTIDYLFINRNKNSQTMHSRVSSSTVSYDVFDGYLRISEREKFHLGSSMHRDQMAAKLKVLAKQLNVAVLDYSGDQAREI